MRIEVNGEGREVDEGTTVGALVGLLGLAPERLAVELNREVVRRALWGETTLREGDKIEVVHFVGGGCGAQTRAPEAGRRFPEPRSLARRITTTELRHAPARQS